METVTTEAPFIPSQVFAAKENQVTGAENIRVGGRYIFVCESTVPSGERAETPFTVLSRPHKKDSTQNPNSLWMVTADSSGKAGEVSLADRGVIPYQGDVMHGHNYIVPDTSEAPNRDAEIKRRFHEKEKLPVATLALTAAVESQDPKKRISYLHTAGELLRRGKHTIEEMHLTMDDIRHIAEGENPHEYQDEAAKVLATIPHR